MADTPSVRIDKSFSYRGTTRVWSNRYHFNGGVPSDNTHWNTLFDAIVNAEKSCFMDDVTIVKAVAYAAGSELPIHDKTYTTVGTAALTGTLPTPGDCAAIIRYATTARSTRNHPIYLFNYYHGVRWIGTDGPDLVASSQVTKFNAYADAWMAGFSDGTITAVRAGPHGATATARLVLPAVRHRDFPAT